MCPDHARDGSAPFLKFGGELHLISVQRNLQTDAIRVPGHSRMLVPTEHEYPTHDNHQLDAGAPDRGPFLFTPPRHNALHVRTGLLPAARSSPPEY